MAAGEQAEALKVLAQIWEEHKDPTLLPEMAELHQGLGDCDEATRELDLAIRELQPIEVLGTEFASPDAALAREALLRARTAKLEARCKPVRAPEPPATDTDESPVTVTQALVSPSAPGAEASLQQQQAPGARKRWPLYVAIGGGVLAAGGVVSWGKMKQTESAIERHLKSPKDQENYVRRSGDLLSQGEDYERLGAILFGAGASVATASLIYWFFSAERPAATPVVQPRPGGATVAVHSKF